MKKGLREIAGRFFIFGIGAEMEKGAVAPELSEWARKGISGIIYFNRNLVEPLQAWQLSRLTKELFPHTPFIMSDEEGGDVKRLVSGATRGINAMGLTATGNPENARRMTNAIGDELRMIGINTVLSPVLDVNCESGNPIIGSRAFSDRSEQVTVYGRAYAEGFHNAGILTAAKHFPGHGAATVDSHLDLPVIDRSRAQIEDHLLPFRTLAQEGLLDMIMSAHILFPQISSEPATLSKWFLTDMIRKEMGFDGLTITDCMEMNAMKVHFGIEKATVRSFIAGMDLILVSHTPDLQRKALEAFIDAAENGEIPYSRIQESLDRIERVRTQITDQDVKLSHQYSFQQVVDFFSKRTDKLDMKLVQDSMVLYQGIIKPFKKEDTIFVFDFMPFITGIEEDNASASLIKKAFEERFSHIKYYALPYSEKAFDIFEKVHGNQGRMILITRTRGRTSAEKLQGLFEALGRQFPDNLHISGRDPYDLKIIQNTKASIATFGLSPFHIKGLMQVLSGDWVPHGTMPVIV